uniref:Essential for reactive oxygen species protein n=1 Tax=Gadus morhua TaxID=8049 RepID=A0A8C5BCK6_GADMO
MGYMTVEEHSSTMLHLRRSPGIRSWSLLVGITSIGLAAAYYSSDSLLWKLFYVAGCLFVAVQNMEEWEEAVFDKGGEGALPGARLRPGAAAGHRLLLPADAERHHGGAQVSTWNACGGRH